MLLFSFPYKKVLAALSLATAVWPAVAQNVPALGQDGPSGTASVINPPPEPVIPVYQQYNYVRSWSPAIPYTDPSQLDYTNTPAQAQVSTVYKDGFNRGFQSVLHNTAPNQRLVSPADNRFLNEQYGFPAYPATGGWGYQAGAFQEQRDWYNGQYPHEDGAAYSLARNGSNGGKRATLTYAPGKSQVGQGRRTETIQGSNAAGDVRIWTLDGNGLPVSTATYAAGELFLETVSAPNESPSGLLPRPPAGNVYKDKEGRVILQQAADSTYTVTNPGLVYRYSYTSTYYVYDEMGLLRYVLPPKATALLEANGFVMTSTILDNLCFQYRYDALGRQVAVQKPGEQGFTEVVYDRKDQVVMRRSPLEAEQNLWEVSLYDAQSRIKTTGLYNDNHSRTYWQDQLDQLIFASPLHEYLNDPAMAGTYPSANSVTGMTWMSYTWYDTYEATDPAHTLYNECLSYATLASGELQSSSPGAELPVRSLRTQGMITGTKIRILPSDQADPASTGEWKVSIPYYDDKGRVIYSYNVDEYQNSPIHKNYTGSQYDFAGRLLVSKHYLYNANSADGYTAHTELTRNIYDAHSGRLDKSLHKVNSGGWKTLASYTYDELGRVKRKTLGTGAEVQDFGYNIRGQLGGINGYYAETGLKQGLSRSFGQSLKYDYGFTQPRYDGRISGMVWRGSNAGLFGRQHAYGYSYDLAGRLRQAEYRTKQNNMITTWNKTDLDYTVSGLYYDKNGNILAMNQRGVKPGGGNIDMDVLSYHYKSNGLSNQLDHVDDGESVNSYGLGDFQDHNPGANDYDYDVNGNVMGDLNRELSKIDYTWFNKPGSVRKQDGSRIDYSYDGAGGKVQELLFDAQAGTTNNTDYIGNFVYKNNKLQYIQTGEGRTAYSLEHETFKEEFFVKDHLGNVRSVLNVETLPAVEYLASYEVASAQLERLLFNTVDEIRVQAPASTDPGNISAGLLDGTNQPVGTSLLVKVMAGDRVQMNVNNFFEAYNKNSDNPLSGDDLLSNIITTLRGGVGGVSGGESHDVNMVDKLFTEDNYINIYEGLVDNATSPDYPKAYLNYVLFDENMQIVTEMSGAFQANGHGEWLNIGTGNEALEVPQNGYLAVYLTNRSRDALCTNCGVYFDMLDVRIGKGQLLEESHYYPHGLPIAGMGSAADGFTENRRKYQSNEYIKDLDLHWMDFNARTYDPQIGRFLGVDPLADAEGQQVWSPYAAMGNAPESMVDPDGTYAYISDFGASRSQAEFNLGQLIGEGNFEIDNQGKITIKDVNRARAVFDAYLRAHGGGGSAATVDLLVQAASGIINNHDNPFKNVIVGFTGNNVSSYSWWMTLPEMTINSGNVDGSLNLVQAAARDIGRNDYNRWRADSYSGLVVGQLIVGGATPFVVVGAVEAAPYLLTGYLSNPAGWNMTAGEVLLGAHGYEGGASGVGAVENVAAKTGTTALRKVGSVLESVDDVLANPSLLQGKSYGYVRNMLGKSEGWVNSVMTKTRGTDKGWVLRQVNGKGQETGRLIQYHPGSRRHYGGAPYWKVSDGANTFRFPAAN